MDSQSHNVRPSFTAQLPRDTHHIGRSCPRMASPYGRKTWRCCSSNGSTGLPASRAPRGAPCHLTRPHNPAPQQHLQAAPSRAQSACQQHQSPTVTSIARLPSGLHLRTHVPRAWAFRASCFRQLPARGHPCSASRRVRAGRHLGPCCWPGQRAGRRSPPCLGVSWWVLVLGRGWRGHAPAAPYPPWPLWRLPPAQSQQGRPPQ